MEAAGDGGRTGAARQARPARPARRAQTVLFWLVLAVLVAGTLAGVLIGRDRALDDVDDRARRTGEAVAAVLQVELEQVAARLAGVGAVVGPDGEVRADAFAAFGEDPFGDDRPGALVLLEVVTAEERPAFEAALGGPITVIDDGRIVTAPTSPVHHPAVAVAGAPPGRSITGIDFGADPARRRAIDAAGRRRGPAVSAPLVLASTGERGVAIVRPVPGPDGEIAGYATMGISTVALAAIIDGAVPTGSDIALLDGEELLVGSEDARVDLDERQLVRVDVPDRSWVVAVRRAGAADFTVTWILAAAGLVAIATTATLLVLTERHHRRLARSNALLVRSESRTRAVQDVAGRLARALTGDEVAAAIVDHLPTAVEAERAVVALVGRGGRLEVLQPGGEARFLDVPPPSGSVLGQVLATREPAWLQSPLGWRDDEQAVDLADGARALAVLPLVADDVAGVLVVAYPQLHIFGDDEQALLQTVGVLAARALARGRRYDAEHQSAVAFQRAALPDAMPDVPGLAIAARYRPAVRGATVGGDWYDALHLPDGQVLLVVGDVVGHGMTAAAAMGRLRTAFQTIVPYSTDPGSMLQRISQHVDSIPDAFCTTVVCVVVDVATATMTWSRAGHPPPLVVRPGAGATLLDQPGLPPLGVVPGVDAPVHQHQLSPGDVLVLYTDGIVERREEALDQGFERLALVTEQLVDLDVEELADALVEAMVPADEQGDDLALLVVRMGRAGSGPR